MLPEHLQNSYQEGDFPVNIKDCLTGSSNDFKSYKNGLIAISHQNQYTQQLATIIQSIYVGNNNQQVQFYNYQKSVDDYIGSDNYEENICFAVDFGSTGESNKYMWSVISKISTERKRSSIILTTHMMEEAEALSTRIAIMVKGQLKCLGSIQHIKNKFGKGYEVELVLSIPTKEEKLERAKSCNKTLNLKIKQHEITQTLDDLKQLRLENEINQDGIGLSIYQALKLQQGLLMDVLIEYIIIQERGMKVQKYIQDNMGTCTIIEQFSAFYRFKIESIVNIGKMFGLFQSKKDEQYINSYSVKQATIEQIFNVKINIKQINSIL